MPTFLVRYLCTLALALATASAVAEDITLKHKGLTLNAGLELAAGKKLSDGVILITHGALAHRRMESIASLQKLLKERGYSSLAINLSLGLDNRQGMYDCAVTHRHRNSDAAEEIDAWLDWLKQRGATRVALFGHSRGGAQTAAHAVERNHALVKAVILLAPATRDNSDPETYQKRTGKPLAPVLDRAQKLVKEGKGDTIIDGVGLMTCNNARATAGSFLSYYGENDRYDTPALIPKIQPPVLVVIAGKDAVVPHLEKRIGPIADGKRVHMTVLKAADHFFLGFHSEDTADAVVAFLNAAGY